MNTSTQSSGATLSTTRETELDNEIERKVKQMTDLMKSASFRLGEVSFSLRWHICDSEWKEGTPDQKLLSRWKDGVAQILEFAEATPIRRIVMGNPITTGSLFHCAYSLFAPSNDSTVVSEGNPKGLNLLSLMLNAVTLPANCHRKETLESRVKLVYEVWQAIMDALNAKVSHSKIDKKGLGEVQVRGTISETEHWDETDGDDSDASESLKSSVPTRCWTVFLKPPREETMSAASSIANVTGPNEGTTGKISLVWTTPRRMEGSGQSTLFDDSPSIAFTFRTIPPSLLASKYTLAYGGPPAISFC